MSEHFDEQISEFIDDEMSPEQCEFFVRRLERDDGARARYMRYQLIGAAVRGEHLQHNALELRQRLDAALARDTSVAPARKPFAAGHRLVAGTGIAAGLALFAAIGWGVAMLDEPPPVVAGVSAAAVTDASPTVAMPSLSLDGSAFAGQILVTHAGYSSGFNRTPMLSSIISAPEDRADVALQAAAVD